MSEGDQEQRAPLLAEMAIKQLVQVALLGAAVGLVIWGLGWLLETHIYKAILCQGDQAAGCEVVNPWAGGTAMIIGAGAGLFGLVRLRVFRPLLIVLAVVVSLWALPEVTRPLLMYQAIAAFVLLHLLAYTTFAWVGRIRHFLLAVILLLALIAAARLALAA